MWFVILLIVFIIISLIPEVQNEEAKYVNFLIKRYQRRCEMHFWGYKANKDNHLNTLVCRICGYRPEEDKFDD